MTEKPYTNLDLDTAESLLIAAGSPEQAKAMRHHTQGIRNFIQGEFGQSFVDAFERVMEKHITPLSEEIHGLRTDVQQSAAESAARLGKLEEGQERLAGEVADLAGRMSASEADRKDMHHRLARLEAVNDRLARIEAAMAAGRGNGK